MALPSVPGHGHQKPHAKPTFSRRDFKAHGHPLLFEKDVAEIRAVDFCVAQRACLKLCCLIVERGRASRTAKCRICVARQAQQIHRAVSQHVLIGSAVWHMTGRATLRLNRVMLKDKRTLDVCVALEADRALLRRHSYLLW